MKLTPISQLLEEIPPAQLAAVIDQAAHEYSMLLLNQDATDPAAVSHLHYLRKLRNAFLKVAGTSVELTQD